MKNRILQTLVLLFFVLGANAQQGINYKAIIKDGEGAAIANTAVTVQFTILESGTTEVYQETHNPTTDANGIVIVNIGEGTVVSGVFNDIDWGSNPHYLKTEINTGSGLTDMGTTEFKTVPYALHAESSAGGVSVLNDLSDAKTNGVAVYIGQNAGQNDPASSYNYNTGIGYETLYNSHEYHNSATGYRALYNCTSGQYNTANGSLALFSNTYGKLNTSVGYKALYSNTTGDDNAAIGGYALLNNINGKYNVAIGGNALSALTSGNNNIGIGFNAQVPNSTGYNQVRIGSDIISYAGIQVAWTITSDIRWKENIRSLPYGLDMLMKLKPVDFTRKNNENRTREMGFIAQDVEKVFNEMGYTDQGILLKDDNGYLHLRYNDFIALLTKAIQEQQTIINSLNDKLEQQEKSINGLNAEVSQLNELDRRIKVIEEFQRVAEK